MAGAAIAPVRMPDGTEPIMAGDRVAVFNSEQGLGFDLAYRPGSLKEMLRQMASGNPDETYRAGADAARSTRNGRRGCS